MSEKISDEYKYTCATCHHAAWFDQDEVTCCVFGFPSANTNSCDMHQKSPSDAPGARLSDDLLVSDTQLPPNAEKRDMDA